MFSEGRKVKNKLKQCNRIDLSYSPDIRFNSSYTSTGLMISPRTMVTEDKYLAHGVNFIRLIFHSHSSDFYRSRLESSIYLFSGVVQLSSVSPVWNYTIMLALRILKLLFSIARSFISFSSLA